jgi:hypothetical protein
MCESIKTWVSNPRPATLYYAVTLVNFVYTVKTTQQFRQVGTQLTAILPRAIREPAYNKR